MEKKFNLRDDRFRIKWDERGTECEVGVYFSAEDKQGKRESFYMEVDLSDSEEYIEKVLEKRAEIRKQLKDDFDLRGIMGLKDDHNCKEVLDFIRKCMELDYDMSREVAFIAKNKALKYIDYFESRIEREKKYIESYKETSEQYKGFIESMAEYYGYLKWLSELLSTSKPI